MKCNHCGKEFKEKDIDESHDVPCYLFEGNRKGRKNQADKFGRHQLCRECHRYYEFTLMEVLRKRAGHFANDFFQKGEEDGSFI